MDLIKKEILLASHLEHFKAAKDLALVYPINHSKRIAIELALADIIKDLNE